MKEKPPVLSDEQIRRSIGKDRKLKTAEDLRAIFELVAEAQRDADVEYIQQACQETARELASMGFYDSPCGKRCLCAPEDEFKAKYEEVT